MPIKTTQALLGALGTAIDVFRLDNGHYPANLNDLVVKPADASAAWKQYLEKIPLDYWRHPFIYECPGKHRTNAYDLSSAGPDGKFGTADDIVNWKLPGK